MKILAIQHSAIDTPGVAGEIALELGHELNVVQLDRGDEIPTSITSEALMTFGSAMSYSRGTLPDWVTTEQRLILEYVRSGRPVLGICFGAQTIAAALGAKVERNEHPEVGWHEIRPVGDHDSVVAEIFAEPVICLHWHRDRFDIPPGADRILESNACPNQGFVIDDRVVGLQFHIEASERTIQVFNKVSDWRHELDSEFVQTEEHVKSGIAKYLPGQRRLLTRLMSHLFH